MAGDTEARPRVRQVKNRVRREAARREQPPAEPTKPKEPQLASEVKPKLFKYRLKEDRTEKEWHIATFRQESEELVKPVIRKPSKPARKPEPIDPRQRPLELVQRPAVKKINSASEPQPILSTPLPPSYSPAALEIQAAREVLFSRVLAGLLDLIVALLTGALFALVAATLMSAELTSPSVMGVAAVCAIAFWVLNTAFFLFVGRQTPGMMVTELELIAETSQPPSLSRVLSRILLQSLSTVSVIGLLWAIFDGQRRCWHDLLSRTLVVPLSDAVVDETARPASASGSVSRRLIRPGGPRR